ncbi:peptidoglycan-associated lipoprotein Pal [Pseudorhodoferax sp. Leaf274]|uniref:peptidoglycan-associated lipoprotein Pal n=1 Tax=Pseudorhodoferax sp. Leaf274 TaxID=1736318 RepID=UPI0007037524|nr:peptidoglycan-associated lipoprotein Pal [Pseudorhodoferax sp. Leaf274]KQP38904.1 peptidoglycan-binding protein [Pseudorhodoferax sp. Leaf274]
MKQFVLTVIVAAALAGCSSPVKLDDVPVQDKSGTSASSIGSQGAGSGNVGQSSVAPVDLSKSNDLAGGPAGARTVYFGYDSYSIEANEQTTIENNARFLRADRNRKTVIEGHTDERGGREYNLALGQKRSEAVRRALGLLGVADGQMEAVSFGKEKPAVQGSDEAAYAKNRRAEITYR